MSEQRGNRFNRRVGLQEFEGWKGLKLQGNPSALDPHNLRAAENFRIHLGQITVRGGQSKLNSVALTGKIIGLWAGGFTLT